MAYRVSLFLWTLTCLVLIVMLSAICMSSAASAELNKISSVSGKNASVKQMKQDVAEMRKKKKQLESKISKIREEAFEQDPGLDRQLKKLVEKENSLMKRNLQEEQVDMKRLQELNNKLKQNDLEPGVRQSLRKEFKELFLGYKRAKMKTNSNKTVIQMRQSFYQNLLSGMKEVNPKAEQMLKQIGVLDHQLKYVKQEAVQNSTSK